MLGILYLVIAVFWGSAVCSLFFPDMLDWAGRSFSGGKIKLCSLFLLLPAWVYTGVIPMTWLVYILSYALRSFENGMWYANLAVMGVFLISGVLIYVVRGVQRELRLPRAKSMALSAGEAVLLIFALYLSLRLFFTTFFVEGDTLYVGLSVFSDFSPHLGMIRSFSSGNNFPTTYSHFAGEDIKYHFMFQFLVGNLEYLGLRLDLAFNIPSVLGMVSTFLLLYVFAAKLTGKRAVGYLACLLFAFRSSFTVFRYLAEQTKGRGVWEAFTENSEFIGYTPNENWGLWNLNVYCNQRHLAFTLGVLLLVLIFFTPHLFAMVQRIRLEWGNVKRAERDGKKNGLLLRKERGGPVLQGVVAPTDQDPEKTEEEEAVGMPDEEDAEIPKRIKFFVRRSFFSAAGWSLGHPAMAAFAGLLLGALAFWNGAVTIAALLVLFIMAALSDHRLDYLVTALIAGALAVLQSMVFIEGSAVSTSFYYGFIAENRTVFGVIDYIFRLTGAALFVTAAAFLLGDAKERIMAAAFAAPFMFAFHMSLTADVTVNHKYIMISLMLFGILEAHVLLKLWEQKKFAMRAAAVFLVLLLSATGIFEYITVLNRNQKQNNLAFDTNAAVTAWIRENATAQDIFLTSNYALNNVVLGGAMLYSGWQYFAWSAGYDTAYRDGQVRMMYEAESVQELSGLIEQNNIRFIIVDHDNRTSGDYEVREDVIASAYEPVYTQDEGDWKLTIYDVEKPLFSK
ncbi:MAG: hypothetical protein K2P87_12630 [Lachnospiraceae bacterium]|nr:hypothetical protein [Lachnospiraceae bacterium]